MADAPIIHCPTCRKSLRVPNATPAGTSIRCPECQTVFRPEIPVDAEIAMAIPADAGPDRVRRVVWSIAGVAVVAALAVAGWYAYLRPEPAPVVKRMPNPTPPEQGSAGPWIQDFEEAKRRAASEKKDVLVSFEGSDWCIWCQRMDKEIFSRPEFLEGAPKNFVLVKVDFPNEAPARSRVEDMARNQALVQRYGVGAYPFVLLTDAAGEPFGNINGFLDGGPVPLLDDLDKIRAVRVRRDELLAKVESADDAGKLPAAAVALAFLNQYQLKQSFDRHLPQWLALAEKLDPDNRGGHLEVFFIGDWLTRYQTTPPAGLGERLAEVEKWKAKHGEFKDSEKRAFILLQMARCKAVAEDFEGALALLEEGRTLKPRDPFAQQALTAGPMALGLGTGTAFAVGPRGHFLTNFHVAGGPGKAFLRLPGSSKLQPARVLAEHPGNDLALLKLETGADDGPPPLRIASDRPARRGEEVGAWGYPFGTSLGGGLKLTKGVVSAPPEAGNRLLLLDLRVNPGSSGSPLCDAQGNVIGLVTAQSNAVPGVAGVQQTYGLAVPGAELVTFLRAHLTGYEGASSATKTPSWEDIDRQVSPSVALVLKARPQVKGLP